jgi:hypothetical protein
MVFLDKDRTVDNVQKNNIFFKYAPFAWSSVTSTDANKPEIMQRTFAAL